MDQYLASSVAPRRFNLFLLLIFAGVALLLAVSGVYAVISYSVSRRTREIGIRGAMGAQRRDIFLLVMRRGLALALVGVAAGLGAALALTHAIKSLLFGISATDPITFIGVALMLIVVALLACYIPAHRATKVDPLTAVRYE